MSPKSPQTLEYKMEKSHRANLIFSWSHHNNPAHSAVSPAQTHSPQIKAAPIFPTEHPWEKITMIYFFWKVSPGAMLLLSSHMV